jgi:hypothetical protein
MTCSSAGVIPVLGGGRTAHTEPSARGERGRVCGIPSRHPSALAQKAGVFRVQGRFYHGKGAARRKAPGERYGAAGSSAGSSTCCSRTSGPGAAGPKIAGTKRVKVRAGAPSRAARGAGRPARQSSRCADRRGQHGAVNTARSTRRGQHGAVNTAGNTRRGQHGRGQHGPRKQLMHRALDAPPQRSPWAGQCRTYRVEMRCPRHSLPLWEQSQRALDTTPGEQVC